MEGGVTLRRVGVLVVTAVALCRPDTAAAADPVIAAAGDIACAASSSSFNGGAGTSTKCRQRHTSDLLVNSGLSAVLALGDLQYHKATLSNFNKSYGPSWGRVKPITFPAAGNHEYLTTGARGYFDYFNGAGSFGGRAGDRDKGYYSFDVGTWHLIALNSGDHCEPVSCAENSAQLRWLEADLAANPAACTLAFWHHPRFNSGHQGNATFTQPLFEALYDADADVVLGGHAHDYERFAPQSPAGKLDRARGIRQFVVGTGGAFFTSLGTTKPNSEIRNANTYGALFLTLRPDSYDWRFVPEAGKRFTDSGSAPCHGDVAPAPQPRAAESPKTVSEAQVTIDVAGKPTPCTIVGTPRDDVLSGTPRDDVICGLAGNDRIRGRDGADTIAGGRGRDVIFGGKGDDLLYGSVANDVLHGQSGDDVLVGGGGRNRLYGNAGDDVLSAWRNRRGVDRVHGGKGRDTATVNSGDSTAFVERVRSRR